MIKLLDFNGKKHHEFLIWLYFFIERAYKEYIFLSCQRLSNNDAPQFTGVELLTTFLFGQINNFDTKKLIPISPLWGMVFPIFQAILEGISVSYLSWMLFLTWTEYIAQYLQSLGWEFSGYDLLDSLPIRVASGFQSITTKVTSQLTDKGCCDSRREWHYEIKLHLQTNARSGKLPVPRHCERTPAFTHDLKVWKSNMLIQEDRIIYADRAYVNQSFQQHLENCNRVSLKTPHKKKNGQPLINLFRQVNNTILI